MLIDRFGRNIHYLRVSVTNNCNYFCQYCRPANRNALVGDPLSLEDLFSIIEFLVQEGISKVKIVGGEPLVRSNIVSLIGRLSHLPGLKYLSMTTNGSLLARYAHALRASGLNRITISLDTLDPDKYTTLTRGGKLDDVLEGIYMAKTVGFNPLRLNVVVMKDFNEKEVPAITKFATDAGIELNLIKQLKIKPGDRYVIENAETSRCEQCNLLRLSSDGHLTPCLFSDSVIDLRHLSKERALSQALKIKPEKGNYDIVDCMPPLGG